MSKQSGLGDALYIAGRDLSGDTQSLDEIGGGPAMLDGQDISMSAMARIPSLRDGRLNWTSYFNKATGQAHLTLGALPTADTIATYCRGTTLGNNAFCLNAKLIDYAGSRATDGGFLFKASMLGNAYGGEWGTLLTAGKRTDGSASNGTGVDLAASTAFGLQAYLHVFAFTGTSVTVKIQESSDNGAGDAYADVTGGAFTAATGVTSQRIATSSSQTVERYLRVVTTGTFTNAVFAVVVMKNVTAVTF